MEIIKELKILRLEANLSQEQLGELIGYSSKVVSAIEAGKRPIGLKTLILWCKALDRNLEINFI
ncbi:DNA-binding XRE family transcriptional regulator [Dyadobacter jejuensis]|uniref:DNA-binding XRE family transcriptional regulator n=1 Tax=Dyadobacter jejuensis TaxID=1082580 RepID=A0A316A7H2_9BACT|nr:helix-turn-helix transcriptional regulator [Dyadobacter jejuensis]PWJ53399.1 DNA-binding XRE family transcriptional regulator [Dyadobacter jejuensis]